MVAQVHHKLGKLLDVDDVFGVFGVGVDDFCASGTERTAKQIFCEPGEGPFRKKKKTKVIGSEGRIKFKQFKKETLQSKYSFTSLLAGAAHSATSVCQLPDPRALEEPDPCRTP